MSAIQQNESVLVSPELKTTSLIVADHFGKQHGHVLRKIEALDIPDEYRLSNFGETVIKRENPSGGEPIKSKAYEMTRDGFSLLVMGFTGKKAMAWKIKFLEAFNAMEKELATIPVKAHRRRKPVITHDNSVTVTFDPAAYVRKARESGVIVAYRKNLTRHNLCYEADDGPLYRFLKTAEHEAFNALRTALVTYLKDNQERLRAEEDVIRLRRQLADAERRVRAAK